MGHPWLLATLQAPRGWGCHHWVRGRGWPSHFDIPWERNGSHIWGLYLFIYPQCTQQSKHRCMSQAGRGHRRLSGHQGQNVWDLQYPHYCFCSVTPPQNHMSFRVQIHIPRGSRYGCDCNTWQQSRQIKMSAVLLFSPGYCLVHDYDFGWFISPCVVPQKENIIS